MAEFYGDLDNNGRIALEDCNIRIWLKAQAGQLDENAKERTNIEYPIGSGNFGGTTSWRRMFLHLSCIDLIDGVIY